MRDASKDQGKEGAKAHKAQRSIRREANFANIINIGSMFIKANFKDSKKVKRIRNYALKCTLYLYFLI